MNEQMQVVKLEPMRVISAWAFGPQPESQAWEKLRTWAEARGVALKDAQIYGFNNPSPSPGSPNYGYEFWLVVSADVEPMPGEDVRVVSAAGGIYAVLAVDVTGDLNTTIPAAWRALDALVAESAYRMGAHQWLERHTSEGVPFAFYYPIAE